MNAGITARAPRMRRDQGRGRRAPVSARLAERARPQQDRQRQRADAVGADAAVAHDVEFLLAGLAAAETVGGVGERRPRAGAGRRHGRGHGERRRRPRRHAQPVCQRVDHGADQRRRRRRRSGTPSAACAKLAPPAGLPRGSGSRVRNRTPAVSSQLGRRGRHSAMRRDVMSVLACPSRCRRRCVRFLEPRADLTASMLGAHGLLDQGAGAATLGRRLHNGACPRNLP